MTARIKNYTLEETLAAIDKAQRSWDTFPQGGLIGRAYPMDLGKAIRMAELFRAEFRYRAQEVSERVQEQEEELDVLSNTIETIRTMSKVDSVLGPQARLNMIIEVLDSDADEAERRTAVRDHNKWTEGYAQGVEDERIAAGSGSSAAPARTSPYRSRASVVKATVAAPPPPKAMPVDDPVPRCRWCDAVATTVVHPSIHSTSEYFICSDCPA